jgi:hypothetical protein
MLNKDGLRAILASVGTGCWLVLAMWWTFVHPTGAWLVPDLPPNAWGDWAAGTFAPLAFLWLVVGYLQQGDELRLNTEVLKLQQLELRNQVAETARLAKNSERQAIAAEQMVAATLEDKHREALREVADALPVFRAIGGIQTGGRTETRIRNVGGTVTHLTAESEEPGVTVSIKPRDFFETDAEGKLDLAGASRFPFNFSITFKDKFDKKHTKRFEMTVPHVIQELPPK